MNAPVIISEPDHKPLPVNVTPAKPIRLYEAVEAMRLADYCDKHGRPFAVSFTK